MQELLGLSCQAEARFTRPLSTMPSRPRQAPRLTVYLRYAYLLRQHLNDPQRADKIMDQLVAANAQSSQASLARARYRRSFGLKNAAEDIAQREIRPR